MSVAPSTHPEATSNDAVASATSAEMKASQQSTIRKGWKLFVCNTYQIAAPFVNRFNASCRDQNERAALLGELIQKERPDIVMLQEMWGGGQKPLEKALAVIQPADSPTHPPTSYFVPHGFRSWWGLSIIDTAIQYANKRGGLWYSYNTATTCEIHKVGNNDCDREGAISAVTATYPHQHTYTFSNTGSRKGVMVTKFAYPTMGRAAHTSPILHEGDVPLIVFNTHLDPINANNAIERQLTELRDVIQQVLSKEAIAANQNQESGASTQRLDVAAVVVGDFNVTPTSPLYQRIFDIMKPTVNIREILSEETKSILTYDPKNPYVLWPQGRGHLDHIFAIDGFELSSSQESNNQYENTGKTIQLRRVNMLHEEVLNQQHHPLVSDHYPFTASIALE